MHLGAILSFIAGYGIATIILSPIFDYIFGWLDKRTSKKQRQRIEKMKSTNNPL